ncbi:MAG: ABC transporter ATP-binding protein [Deltaproteobacteria bacterium]|nr:ABC transporter ATP-binding protein [Deltaproteobacteria bacterium]
MDHTDEQEKTHRMDDVIAIFNSLKGFPELWRVFKSAAVYIQLFWKIRIAIWVLLAAGAFCSIIHPLLYRRLIDQGFINGDVDAQFKVIGALAALKLVQVILSAVSNYLSSYLNAHILKDMSERAYQRVLKFPIGFFTRTQIGEMITILRGDVSSINNLFNHFFTAVGMSLIKFVMLLAVVFYLDWQLTLICLSVVPLVLVHQLWVGPRIRAYTKEIFKRRTKVNSYINERLNVIKMVQIFTREPQEAQSYAEKHQRLFDDKMKMARFASVSIPLGQILQFCIPLLVWFFGGIKVVTGATTIGTVLAFYMYVNNLFKEIGQFTKLNINAQRYSVSLERIYDLLNRDIPLKEKVGAIEIPRPARAVVFDNVDFDYEPGQTLLRDISFTINKGERLALVGETGVGKTTTAALLFRFFDPQKGRILIDGHDIRDVTLSSLRGHIGVVSQDPQFLNHTIERNLRYAKPDATLDEMIGACKKARLHDFIGSLPEGYQTMIGKGGNRLSGGERQRLTIAQVILRNPAILILDEATSHLDSVTEGLVHEAVVEIMKDRITLIIAHRFSTIRDADMILVMRKGQIVERGSHNDLYHSSIYYREFFDRQFSEQTKTT